MAAIYRHKGVYMKTVIKWVVIPFAFWIVLTLYGFHLLSIQEAEAAEIDLGELSLSHRQIGRFSELNSSVINGFHKKGTSVFVNTSRPIAESERLQIILDVQALSDAPLPHEQDKIDYASNIFFQMTPAEAATWVDTNVQTMPDVRTALKDLIKIVIYMKSQTDLDQ